MAQNFFILKKKQSQRGFAIDAQVQDRQSADAIFDNLKKKIERGEDGNEPVSLRMDDEFANVLREETVIPKTISEKSLKSLNDSQLVKGEFKKQVQDKAKSSAKRKIRRTVLRRIALFLVSNPVGWIIIIVIVVLIIVLIALAAASNDPATVIRTECIEGLTGGQTYYECLRGIASDQIRSVSAR